MGYTILISHYLCICLPHLHFSMFSVVFTCLFVDSWELVRNVFSPGNKVGYQNEHMYWKTS